MSDGEAMVPPDGIGQAVLDAARIAGIGIIVSCLEGQSSRNVWVSERASEILGRPASELIVGDAFSSVRPEERERLIAQQRRRLSGEVVPSTFESMIVRPDGATVPISVGVSYVQSRGERLLVAFIEDVTERQRAREALRASDARFRKLMEDAPDGVVISRRGVVLWANDAAARLLGYPTGAAMLDTTIEAHLDADGVRMMRERIERAIRTGERGQPHEYPARRVDGGSVVARSRRTRSSTTAGPR